MTDLKDRCTHRTARSEVAERGLLSLKQRDSAAPAGGAAPDLHRQARDRAHALVHKPVGRLAADAAAATEKLRPSIGGTGSGVDEHDVERLQVMPRRPDRVHRRGEMPGRVEMRPGMGRQFNCSTAQPPPPGTFCNVEAGKKRRTSSMLSECSV